MDGATCTSTALRHVEYPGMQLSTRAPAFRSSSLHFITHGIKQKNIVWAKVVYWRLCIQAQSGSLPCMPLEVHGVEQIVAAYMAIPVRVRGFGSEPPNQAAPGIGLTIILQLESTLIWMQMVTGLPLLVG